MSPKDIRPVDGPLVAVNRTVSMLSKVLGSAEAVGLIAAAPSNCYDLKRRSPCVNERAKGRHISALVRFWLCETWFALNSTAWWKRAHIDGIFQSSRKLEAKQPGIFLVARPNALSREEQPALSECTLQKRRDSKGGPARGGGRKSAPRVAAYADSSSNPVEEVKKTKVFFREREGGRRMEEVAMAWAIACTVGVAAALYWMVYVMGAAEQRGKRAVELGGGSISRHQVADNYKQYWAFFQKPKEIEKADKVPTVVDTFYNLVTDIYEWGWGQSFHFSPAVPGKSHKEETRLHEVRVSELLGIKAGERVLDAGCGVGGPMRAIAAHSGANVVGITINDYQVERARSHNKKSGLDGVCEVVCGNFLRMPFADESFDGAYSIEATCHAPRLEDVYAEIYRVLKPGRRYVTYEWVTTPKFRPDSADHVEIVHGIEQGDALPGIRNYNQIVEIARAVGFEVLEERDLALPPAHPWWKRLKMGRFAYYRNHLVIALLSFLGIAPQGVVDVHEMLFKTADYLTRGGETGIFTPMHLMVCRKPLPESKTLPPM